MAARKRAGGYLANPSFGEREESDGDEEPPTGDFERASAEELKKRKLIRARRRPAGGRADGSGGGSGGSSVFKGVKLVAGAKPAATAISAASSRPAQPRNPASVFGGGSATAPRAIVSAKAGATFGGLPASKMANPFAAAAKAGTGLASLPSSNPFAKALSGAPSSVLGSVGGGTRPAGAGNADAAAPGRTRPEASRPTPTSSSGPAPSPSAPSASHASGGSSEAGSNRATAGSRQAFYADMRALNADFASWVAQQAKEKPVSSWEQGAKDYVEHAVAIAKKHRHAGESTNAGRSGSPSGKQAVSVPAGPGEESAIEWDPAKLHRLQTNPDGKESSWVDMGKGKLALLTDPDSKRSRLTFSNSAGRVLVNSWLYKHTNANRQGKSHVAVTLLHEDKLQKFLLKVRSADEADKLKAAIADLQPRGELQK